MNHFYILIALLCFFVTPNLSFAQANGEENKTIRQQLTPQKAHTKNLAPNKSRSKSNHYRTDKVVLTSPRQKQAIQNNRLGTSVSAKTSPDRTFARGEKLSPPTMTPYSQKTIEEQITDIERTIDSLNESTDPKKNLKVEKLEKLLEKKKLEKFSLDK